MHRAARRGNGRISHGAAYIKHRVTFIPLEKCESARRKFTTASRNPADRNDNSAANDPPKRVKAAADHAGPSTESRLIRRDILEDKIDGKSREPTNYTRQLKTILDREWRKVESVTEDSSVEKSTKYEKQPGSANGQAIFKDKPSLAAERAELPLPSRQFNPSSSKHPNPTWDHELLSPSSLDIRNQFLGSEEISKEEVVVRGLRLVEDMVAAERKHGQDLKSGNDNSAALEDPAWKNADSARIRSIKNNGPINNTQDIQNGTPPSSQGSFLQAIDSHVQNLATHKTSRMNPNFQNSRSTKHESPRTFPPRTSKTGQSEIDWSSLPLSPLLDQSLSEARTRHRSPKIRPNKSFSYDQEYSDRIKNDYLASMLSSPVRACRLSSARLPEAFLLTLKPMFYPDRKQIWEVPDISQAVGLRSDDDPALEAKIRDEFIEESKIQQHRSSSLGKQTAANLVTSEATPELLDLEEKSDSTAPTPTVASPDAQDLLDARPKVAVDPRTTAPDEASIHSVATTRSSTVPPNSKHEEIHFTNLKTHMLSTYNVIQIFSNYSDWAHKRVIPINWRNNLDPTVVAKISRPPDMANLALALMRQRMLVRFKALRSLARRGSVGVCFAKDDYQGRGYQLPPTFTDGVLLYFGHDGLQNAPAFDQIVKAFIEKQESRVEAIDDVVQGSPAGSIAHAFRIRYSEGNNVMFYDMTRMFSPADLETLRQGGFEELVYYVANWRDCHSFFRGLYSLAHYIDNPRPREASVWT